MKDDKPPVEPPAQEEPVDPVSEQLASSVAANYFPESSPFFVLAKKACLDVLRLTRVQGRRIQQLEDSLGEFYQGYEALYPTMGGPLSGTAGRARIVLANNPEETPAPARKVKLEELKRDEVKVGDLEGYYVRVWQGDHGGDWWRPGGRGYTRDISKAGVFRFMDAWNRSSHCGPEKQIEYEIL